MATRVLWVLVLAAGSVLAGARPNVLFLIADDLGAQALGCYGNREVRTPHIDALAARGVRFTRAYCQFPVCGPSRAALMSGLYPQQNGVVGNGSSDRLAATLGKRPTVAEHFRKNGYHTARVSKIYHMRVPGDITAGVDGPDHPASWTERFNCRGPEWMTKGEAELLSAKRPRFEPDEHYNLGFGTAFYVVRGSGDGSEQSDHQAATKAVELIGRHKERPFFLAVGFVRPHVPLVAPRACYDPYPPGRMSLPESVEEDWEDIPKAGIGSTMGLKGNPEQQKRTLAAYYASVSFMDAQVGRVLRALEESGLKERTVVVFTSDHGYHLGEHGFWQKMSLHEESTRVPLVISAPGIKPAVSGSLAEAVDLYPTWCELGGLPVPDHCEGASLLPVLRDSEHEVRVAAYCFRGNAHLLRTRRWAYLKYDRGGEELYDMVADPRQFTNLASTNPGALTKMRRMLREKLEGINGRR